MTVEKTAVQRDEVPRLRHGILALSSIEGYAAPSHSLACDNMNMVI